jgi:hypothetical protein
VKRWGSKPLRNCHTCQPNLSSCRIPQLDDIKALNDDVRGLQGPTSWCEGKTPLGPGLPKCLWWNVLPFLWCKPLVSLCPWLGSSTSIWWGFSPMEVRANHLPICTCPSSMVLQQQQVRPPWAHKSWIIAMSITSNNQVTQTCA